MALNILGEGLLPESGGARVHCSQQAHSLRPNSAICQSYKLGQVTNYLGWVSFAFSSGKGENRC